MQSAPHAAQRFRLAWLFLVAYLLTVAYASGYPFRGWRVPTEETLHFLTAPWPRYITLNDLLFNVGAYIPLGFLLTVALRPRLRSRRAVLCSIALGAAWSIGMEYMQTLLPGRYASNVDVLTNALGSMMGAFAAPLFAPTRHIGRRLAALHRRWFAAGWWADTGLALVCAWLLTPMHPTAQLLGTGDLRATLDLQPWFLYAPGVALTVDATVSCFNLAGLGLLLAEVTLPQAPLPRLLAAVLGAACLVKAATAATLGDVPVWSWVTPGLVIGVPLGAVVLYVFLRAPRRARALSAVCLILAATCIINIAPANPYQTVLPQFLTGGVTHFLSFSGIMQALCELWPFAAMAYLAGIATQPASHASRRSCL